MRKNVLILALLALAAGARAQETTISGFVDAAYFHSSEEKNGEFSLDQVEINVVHQASEKSLLRADLEWIRIGDEMVAQVEQGFMTYSFDRGWDFTFGKFNAPMGFEALDPTDMYQYSHSLVFIYGGPESLTGAALAREFGRGFDIVAHASNGWDANTMAGKNVTWGGRFGYGNGGFGGGLSFLGGKEEDEITTEGFARTVFDIDLSFETGMWLFGGEYNQGQVTYDDAVTNPDQEWNGFLVMTHVAYADWTGLTLRWEIFDDQDGFAFDAVNGEFQQRQSFTICPTFRLDENFGALVELRIDKSDRDAFTDKDGEPKDSTTSVAFEMTYSW